MYILRAKIYWGRGLTEQGNVDIRVAAMMEPHHPEVVSFFNRSFLKAEILYKDAVKHFASGNYKEALLAVNHAMHITTEDVKLLILQSKVYRMLGELLSAYDSMLRAKAVFEKAFQGTDYPMELPSDIVLQINLILNDMSIDYASKGNYDKAILLLNKVIKTEQSLSKGGLLKVNHKYFVNRGDCHRASNSLADAVYDYNLALELKPDDWDIKTRLSLTHYLISTVYFNESRLFNLIRRSQNITSPGGGRTTFKATSSRPRRTLRSHWSWTTATMRCASG
jgi:tetratricopeptide (TPR) repeat protein